MQQWPWLYSHVKLIKVYKNSNLEKPSLILIWKISIDNTREPLNTCKKVLNLKY